jgi:hypothetical protein
LHAFNPAALPYDRVIFLDLDMLILKNIDDLFEVRPPAAMYNTKTRSGFSKASLKHGERMDPRDTYINAGTMVIAPSQLLFDLLSGDVGLADPMWHTGGWSPEQLYLSKVLAGEWSHVSQLYNLEVQLHSGVPISHVWENAQAKDVAVAHFSGSKKVWDCEPDNVVPAFMNDWMQQTFTRLAPKVRSNVTMRCRALHAEWHRNLARAARNCRMNGEGRIDNLTWAPLLHRVLKIREGLPLVAVGDTVTLCSDDHTIHAATVVRLRGNDVVLWRTPLPSEMSFCSGTFGICLSLKPSERLLATLPTGDTLNVGLQVVVWGGEGHVRGLVTASTGKEFLIQCDERAPQWHSKDELQLENAVKQSTELQCIVCLAWSVGSFVKACWHCESCRIEGCHHKTV